MSDYAENRQSIKTKVREANTPIVVTSNQSYNRKGFRIETKSLDFSLYDLNPIMYPDHDRREGIGRMQDKKIVKREGGNKDVMFTPVFNENSELGLKWMDMYINGFTNSASIGGLCQLSEDKTECIHFLVEEISLTYLQADPYAVAKISLNSEEKEELLTDIKDLSITKYEIPKDYEDKGYFRFNLSAEIFKDEILIEELTTNTNIMEDQANKNPVVTEDPIILKDELKTDKLSDDSDSDADMCMKKEDTKKDDEEMLSESEWEEKEKKKDEMKEKKLSQSEWEKIRKEKKIIAPEKEKLQLNYNPDKPMYKNDNQNVKVSNSRETIYSIIKREGKTTEEGIEKILQLSADGTESEKLNIMQAIKMTQNGSTFLSQAKINLQDNEESKTKKTFLVDEYIRNKETLSAPLVDHINKGNVMNLNASTDFIANPALDKISFLTMYFLKLFPGNNWRSGIPMLPATVVGNNVGTVWANVIFNPTVTTQAAMTRITSPATPATVDMYADSTVSMQIYEHILQPMTWRNYNREIVAYDQLGLQWDVALKSLDQTMNDYDIYLISVAINNLATKKFNSLTGAATALTNMSLLPSITGTANGLSQADISSMQGYLLSQNVIPEKTTLLLDAWMLYSLTNDLSVNSVLNRFTQGNEVSKLKILGSTIEERSYYGRYDTATNTIVPPSAATSSTQIQYGLMTTAEYLMLGLASFEMFAWNSPQLYGEVYSAQIKSGANVAYGADARGNALIIPTKL